MNRNNASETLDPMRAPLLVASLLTVVLAGCSSANAYVPVGEPTEQTQESTGHRLVAADQLASGSLFVELTTLDDTDGYVAVYSTVNSAPAEQVAVSELLKAGDHNALQLGEDLKPGTYFVILHEERSGNTTLNYPGPDAPLEEEGRVLSLTVNLTANG